MENIWSNPYISKILLSVIPLIFKEILKSENNFKGFQKLFLVFIYYIFPVGIIFWINLDSNIDDTKLTFTIIAFNIGLIIFNYFQTIIAETNKMLTDLANTEYDKIEKVNQINAVQIEKVKAINENQKYILNELSKINDRLIGYFKDIKK